MVLTGSAFTPASIPELFAAQVERTPHAVALSDGQRSMTYRQLDQAANRLAHLLAAHGAGPASLWPCCCRGRHTRSRRSWRCSKPGRLPTHRPRHPPARIDFMVDDANPSLPSPPLSWPAASTDTTCSWSTSMTPNRGPAQHRATGAVPDDVAYLIYTSGTTGCPRVWRSPTTTSPNC
ncbi:AMP-binding enzyme family protein [Mycobacterium xenopi 4042]|uniref:AMP-binding enzyme family protein n=1 Tax=Mycobacterium xenopi 4042 TaxID=1299334 RepID=X8AJN9_MYCXE|nr:AMP-binding enzyme family protein [Mycobacterium xenopi 4042]